jgi:hypothetical protein
MGRPIKKSWFGPATLDGSQIVVDGVKFADGSTATGAHIVKQTGSAAYVVSNGTKAEICFMVNADSVGALLPSQCFITATPFGGTALPCETIAQYRVSLYETPNSVPRKTGDPAVSAVGNYRWSAIPAAIAGQADLITEGLTPAPPAPVPISPTNTSPPVVSPTTGVVGNMLSVTDGTWVGDAPVVYTYQWTLNGVDISGATGNTHPSTSVGTHACEVTGTNGAGSATATSNSSDIS